MSQIPGAGGLLAAQPVPGFLVARSVFWLHKGCKARGLGSFRVSPTHNPAHQVQSYGMFLKHPV